MLPDDNIDVALQSLTKLEQERGVIDRDFAAIDLRLLDRITLRLREATAAVDAAAAPIDVPNAATGSMPPNGKT
jgi:hypothetical protein